MIKILLTASILLWTPVLAGAQKVWTISEPSTPKTIYEGELKMGGTAPDGGSIGVNSYYISRDGKPIIPIVGEFHYLRYPAQQWEEEIIKMKGGGVNVIASYIHWCFHEENEGEWNWSGNRDVRHFIELCGKHGIDVIIRIGPFGHGEVRQGAFPDWLFAKNLDIRCDDPLYLHYTDLLYQQIARQLEGLYYKDGGPIICCQLENELQHSAAPWGIHYPGEPMDYTSAEMDKGITQIGVKAVDKKKINTVELGQQHIMTLKRMAEKNGIVTPLYTCTGWGYAAGLGFEGIPVTAAYPYAYWEAPALSRMLTFRDIQKVPDYSPVRYEGEHFPSFPAEMGAGMQMIYNRRPIVTAEAAEALTIRMLGGGANGVGYYMYHGGSTPKMQGGVGSFNDEPMGQPKVSYDFQAPLGEFGLETPTFRTLRVVHNFLLDFQDRLAPMEVVLPENAASITPDNRDDLRYSVRMKDGAGFVFMINFQDHDAGRHDQNDLVLQINLKNETLRIPSAGTFTLPKDASAILPFNMDMDGILLKYATAQPLMKIDDGGVPHWFFFAPDGMAPEFLFDKGTTASGNNLFRVEAGLESTFTVRGKGGKKVKVTTLTRGQALNSFKVNGKLLITDATVLPGADNVELLNLGDNAFDYILYPVMKKGNAVFETFHNSVEAVTPEYTYDCHVPRRAEVGFDMPSLPQIKDWFLRFEYTGDVAMAFVDNTLVLDHFWFGQPWTISLKRFESSLKNGGKVGFYVRPMYAGAEYLIDIPEDAVPDLSNGPVWDIKGAKVIPEYRLDITESLR